MWKCKHCGEDVEDSLACWNCGYSKEGTPPADPEVFADTKEEAVDLGMGEQDEPRREPDLRGPISMAQAAWAESVIGELRNRSGDPSVRYPLVPLVVGLLRILACVAAVITGAFAFYIFLVIPDRGSDSSLMWLLWWLSGGATVFALLLAASEGLRILRDIEENTRHAAMSQCGKDRES